MGKRSLAAALSIASVWFITHFGGGFSSGRQIAEFYVQYGWFAVFMPTIAVGIIGLVYYYGWRCSVKHRVFDYRSWSNMIYRPYQKIFSNLFEAVFLVLFITATAIAFATGGATIAKMVGTPYILNTVVIALVIFFLTVFGAKVVRGASSAMAAIVIGGMLLIYGTSIWMNHPEIVGILGSGETTEGFFPAFSKMLLYAGFQVPLIGSFVAVSDVLKTKRDVFLAAAFGFIINAAILQISTLGVLGYYPNIVSVDVPALEVAFGVEGYIPMAGDIISILITVAVISTGVNLVYGGSRRITAWWGGGEPSLKHNIIASGIFVLITWAIGLFGLVDLVAKGYSAVGYLGWLVIIIPILYQGVRQGY